MPPTLKRLSPDGVESALERAERYRLLNEPSQAESICLDILEIEPANQKALVLLLLAITDAFSAGTSRVALALALLPRLDGEYNRAYYDGLIHERQARALIARGTPGSGYGAHAALVRAMEAFEKAEELRPAGNDDSILRFNACVRFMTSQPSIREAPQSDPSDLME